MPRRLLGGGERGKARALSLNPAAREVLLACLSPHRFSFFNMNPSFSSWGLRCRFGRGMEKVREVETSICCSPVDKEVIVQFLLEMLF